MEVYGSEYTGNKSENYLYLQTEQLLEACQKFLRKKKLNNYLENNTIKYYLKYASSNKQIKLMKNVKYP